MRSREPAPQVGLPPRPFLYTVDQISVLVNMDERTLHVVHIYHEGRDIGTKHRHHMTARNIAAPNQKPDWRIAEKELIRWLRLKGFKYYDRGVITG